MNKFVGALFALTCFATSALSSSIMGAGLWFWVIVASGLLVAICQWFPMLQSLAAGVALLLSTLSIIAVLLGLLASTIGGSFNIDGSSALLLFLFFIIAVLGFVVSSIYRRSVRAGGGDEG
tara:strand:- start:1365 stop:1727 length:363 start_codon:yes stop_codon:yes gene_type:complete